MNIRRFRKLSRPADSCFVLLLSILTNIYMKQEAQVMEKAILANIPDCWRAKTSGLELSLALAADPRVNLAAEKADRPKELAWHVGKALSE
jgi:hypothetical protein